MLAISFAHRGGDFVRAGQVYSSVAFSHNALWKWARLCLKDFLLFVGLHEFSDVLWNVVRMPIWLWYHCGLGVPVSDCGRVTMVYRTWHYRLVGKYAVLVFYVSSRKVSPTKELKYDDWYDMIGCENRSRYVRNVVKLWSEVTWNIPPIQYYIIKEINKQDLFISFL